MASLQTLLGTAMIAALVSAPARADVLDTPAERHLMLPSAPVELTIPRGDWVITREQRRTGDTAVYYALTSEQRGMILSVFIDKTGTCQSAQACRDASTKNPSYKDAKDLKSLGIGNFSVSQFFLDQPQGLALKQANLLASAYVQGYWFDVHISKAGPERPDPTLLVDLLKEIAIK